VLSLRELLEARSAVPVDISPDGASVLVLSNLTGTMQLHLARSAGGELVRLTDLEEPVATARFSPDGRRIVVVHDEGGNERYQLSLLAPEPRAPLEPLVHDPEHMHLGPRFSPDGSLLAYACNRRNGTDFDVFVRDLGSGEERTVFALGSMCAPTAFSPDGRWLGVERLTERPADNDLYLVELAGGEVVHATPHDDEARFDGTAWLPDSSGFFVATNSGRDTAGIARYDVASRQWEYVLESRWDLRCWTDAAGRHLLVLANEDGYSRLELRDPGTLALTRSIELPGAGVVTNPRPPADPVLARDGGTFAVYFASPVEPGDVWLADTATGASRRLTRSPGVPDPGELVEPSPHRYASFDGEPVPVFLWEPRAGERPAPVLVVVHGGPEAQFQPTWRNGELVQYLVARGFAVAAPNVRGSTGYGKRWEHLDDVHKRLDSVRDLVSLHEWLVARGYDGERVALFGGSYGGYMVLAGLAFHPELWAAGIDVVGISNLVTFLESTAPWRRSFREREYGSLARDRELLESVSPLTHVDRIRAPLFVIHGANDPRVPLSEAEQLHAALTERGVPCELLVYGDEGHGLQRLANRLDAFPRAAEWLERVLAREPVPPR
jgi:dipeptidyl aminopeptidase/acylaminoacyl peptidase